MSQPTSPPHDEPERSEPSLDPPFDTLTPSPYNRGRWWLPSEGRELTCGIRITIKVGETIMHGRIEYDHDLQQYVVLVHHVEIVLRPGLQMRLHYD